MSKNEEFYFLERYRIAKEKKVTVKLLLFIQNNYFSLFELLQSRQSLEQAYIDFKASYPNTRTIIFAYYYIRKYPLDEYNNLVGKYYLPYVQVDSVKEFQRSYEGWLSEQEQEFKYDMEQLEKLNEFTESLEEYPILQYTPPSIDGTSLSADVLDLDNYPITELNALEIFDSSILSADIPYIQINTSEGECFTKVFISDFPIEYIRVPPNEYIDKNMIYFKLRTRIQVSSTMFTFVKINLYTSMLSLSIKNTGAIKESEIITSILKAFPRIRLGKLTSSGYSGRFLFRNFTYEEYELLDYFTVEPITAPYIYIKEDRPFALQRRLNLHLKDRVGDVKNSGFSVKVVLEKIGTDPSTNVPQVSVLFSKASSLNSVYAFIYIFSKLVGLLSNDQPAILAYKKSMKEDYALVLEALRLKNKELYSPKGRGSIQLQGLQGLDPEIFPQTTYAQQCGHGGRKGNKQPQYIPKDRPDLFDIVRSDMVTYYKGKGPKRVQRTDPRSILRFPKFDDSDALGKHVDDYYFYCPGNKFPFIGITVNRSTMAAKYPYIPCCQQSYQDPDEMYRRLLHRLPPPIKESNKKEVGKNRTVPIGKEGNLHLELAKFFNLIESGPVRRLYVPKGKFSFFDATTMALGLSPHPVVDIILTLHKEVGLQENYEFVNNLRAFELIPRIKELMARPTGYFCPTEYIRFVEESLNVNIFVFREDELDIPRHTGVYLKDKIYRSTVALYKHEAEIRTDGYPHFEIISVNGKSVWTGKREIDLFFGLFHSITRSIAVLADTSLQIYQNFYITDPLLDMKILAQRVDEHGKMAGGIYQTESGAFLSIGYNVARFAPKNAPLVTIENYMNPRVLLGEKGTKSIYYPPYSAIIQRFGKPNAAVRDLRSELEIKTKEIRAVWYPFNGIDAGIFIMVEPFIDDSIPNEPIPPKFISADSSSVDLFSKVKRNANILQQLMIWLYMLSIKDSNGEFPEVKSFMDSISHTTYVKVQTYDFSKLSNNLPELSTQNAILYLKANTGSLVRDDKIEFNSSKLRERVGLMLGDFKRQLEGAKLLYPKTIKGLYDETRFKQQSNVMLFISRQAYEAWHDIKSVPKKLVVETYYIEGELIKQDLFIGEIDEAVFIIQNKSVATLSNAISSAVFWERYHINLGYHYTFEKSDQIVPHCIYTIVGEKIVNEKINKAPDEQNFVEIFRYPTSGLYAPMLRIISR